MTAKIIYPNFRKPREKVDLREVTRDIELQRWTAHRVKVSKPSDPKDAA